MARQLKDPDVLATLATTGRRSTWVRTINPAAAAAPNVGIEYFYEDGLAAAHGNEQVMTEEEGMVWLAFYNPAMTPCVDAFQITMNTEPFDIQSLDFEQVHLQTGDVIIEMKEPWTLPPEQSGLIEVHYFQAGTDEMRPLGIYVKQARNLRALLTP
ncbi:hypothetical protein ES703_118473 [subsurface metagenome]